MPEWEFISNEYDLPTVYKQQYSIAFSGKIITARQGLINLSLFSIKLESNENLSETFL